MMNTKQNARRVPSLFVPHGSPMWVLRPGAAGAAMAAAASELPPLRAIVVISAHWDTQDLVVGYDDRPETLYDFWGFPDELYSIRYPATGCREAAAEVESCLRAAGFATTPDRSRGLDHGAWIPLRMMFPDADVPIVPLSIQSRLGTAHHLKVGRALAPLAERGILVLASGNMTHNLRDLQFAREGSGGQLGYLRDFPAWMADRLAAGDLPALLDYRRRAPDAVRAHPTEEHLLPLFVALGAAGENFEARRIHAGIDEFVLAMDAYSFAAKEPS